MPILRILVADDHEIVRSGICAMLKEHAGWEVCAEAIDGREAVKKANQLKPDIIIVDIAMPNLNGLEATRQILQRLTSSQVLVLTMYESEQIVREVLEAGARGYVLKSDAGRDLISAVEALQRKETFFTSTVAEMVLNAFRRRKLRTSEDGRTLEVLTTRERELVQLLAGGKSTKEVAAILNLSTKTAETHRSNVMHKLRIHSAGELVLYAIRHNIIQVPTLGRNAGLG